MGGASATNTIEYVTIASTGNAQDFGDLTATLEDCLLYTSPSPRDVEESRMPSSA